MAATACVLGQLYNLPLYSETPFSEDVLTSTWSQACCRKYVFSVVVHSCNSLHCWDVGASCRFLLHLRCYCGTMLMVAFVAWFAVYNSIYPLVVWEVEFGSLAAQKVILCSDFVHAGIGVWWTSCSYQLFPFSCWLQAACFKILLDSYHCTTLIKSYYILR